MSGQEARSAASTKFVPPADNDKALPAGSQQSTSARAGGTEIRVCPECEAQASARDTSAAQDQHEDLDAEGFGYWPQEAQDAILRRDAEIERLREALRQSYGAANLLMREFHGA